MDRQDLAFLLSIVALDCSRCDASHPQPDAPEADPPLPDWSGAYLNAFDRFLQGDPQAPLVMREAAGENVPRRVAAAGLGHARDAATYAHRVIEELQAELECRADPDKKIWWESYVKGASFRGTQMREIRSAVADWLSSLPELSTAQRKGLAIELMRQPLTEDKLAGMLILSEHLVDELGPDDLPVFRALFDEKYLADWSACDWFCVKVLGRMLERSPEREQIADQLIEWTRSDKLWLRRAGIVAFVNLAPKGDSALPGLTARVIAGASRNAADSRRFAQTSVGWVLRELSRAEPEAVRRFLAERGEGLSAEARRAASAKL